jgi:hypothetical protein
VWKCVRQDQVDSSEVDTDNDWGGNSKDRRSTSGGTWRIGKHTIKTSSVTQGAYALSSAEAELYSMIEGVTRAKGLLSLAWELGFGGLSNVLELGTDSSAAKSFVCRRGLGKMRHVEIRDLWLQREVAMGKLIVRKIPGERNPADLMTKVLSLSDIRYRLDSFHQEFSELSTSPSPPPVAAISPEFLHVSSYPSPDDKRNSSPHCCPSPTPEHLTNLRNPTPKPNSTILSPVSPLQSYYTIPPPPNSMHTPLV